MSDRRSVYFAFQGLLTAVLLLQFLIHSGLEDGGSFALLAAALAAPMVFIQLASKATLGRWWFQTGFFLFDAGAATWALWLGGAAPSAYLIYVLIIFGTALTRSFRQSLAVGACSCLLFWIVSRDGPGIPPLGSEFWLHFQLLLVTTTLLSLLARDAQKTQGDQETRFQQRLIEAERLATLGRVAGEVAHRIKGPLTTIKVNAEVLQHRLAGSKDALKQLVEIEEEVDHCKRILRNLLDLGRIEEMDFEPFDLREPIRQALRVLETQMSHKRVHLRTTGLGKPLQARGDQSLLQEAVAAVLQNAVDSVAEGGKISLSVERARNSRMLRVVIEDNGRGIAEGELDRIFQPFFTTKAEGTGLGLSAALRILQKHNGSIEAFSEGAAQGARFTLTLPGV